MAYPGPTLGLFFAATLAGLYVVTLVSAPIAVMPAFSHDDGLYMLLGSYLAHGMWLGPFGQFTLMKGPGYPVFLALANRLGLSVTLAHALFHCAAPSFFVAIAYRFMRSLWLCAILFVMLLWHPLSFTQPLLRVLRDAIYYDQVLIFVAASMYALFGAQSRKERLIYGAISGACFGWLWLTREEGVWLLPAIALVVAIAIARAYRAGMLVQAAGTLVIAAGSFGAIQIGFETANWGVYSKFVGVDIKEANFQRALKAIDGVESGGTRPFIPVTRAARERVYTVSPAFASLRGYFEGSSGKGWTDLSCWAQSETCGEIGAAFFLWSLRDAAAAAGHYASPQAASAFFGQIADEVSAACQRGALTCSPPLIAEMPHVTARQFLRAPALYLTALNMLLLRPPLPITAEPSSGNAQTLEANLQFLHHPLHTPSREIPPGVTLLGWYYRAADDWFSARLTRGGGADAVTAFRRLESPDIARAFHDDAAGTQRFSLNGDCGGECTLELSTPDGATLTVESSQLRPGASFPLGKGTIHFDVAHDESPMKLARWTIASAHIRQAVSDWYGLFLVPILLSGVVAFFASSIRYFRAALRNVCYVMALTLWVLVFARVTLFVLISATSFNALYMHYLAPADFLLVGAAVLSVGAWMQLIRSTVPAAKPGLVDTRAAVS